MYAITRVPDVDGLFADLEDEFEDALAGDGSSPSHPTSQHHGLPLPDFADDDLSFLSEDLVNKYMGDQAFLTVSAALFVMRQDHFPNHYAAPLRWLPVSFLCNKHR